MNVAAVQQHFRDLAVFVRSAGGTQKLGDELSAIAVALEPFGAYRFDQFAEFLERAEVYDRTKAGEPPTVAKKTRSPRTPKQPAPTGPSAADVARRITTLYQTIVNTTLTPEEVEAELALLDGPTVPLLQQIADGIHLGEKVKKAKTKPEKVALLKQAIRDRRGVNQRADY